MGILASNYISHTHQLRRDTARVVASRKGVWQLPLQFDWPHKNFHLAHQTFSSVTGFLCMMQYVLGLGLTHIIGTCTHLVSCPDPSRKIEKGSGNTAIQCLVPEEFNRSCNHVLMLVYAVEIEGVHSCMACVIESFCNISSSWSCGSEALAYE